MNLMGEGGKRNSTREKKPPKYFQGEVVLFRMQDADYGNYSGAKPTDAKVEINGI